MDTNSIMEKIKELVRKGNVSRILVRKGEKVLVDVPVNAGIAVGVATLALSKFLLIAGALATVGFGCVVEIVKDDGQIVDILTEENAQKARETAAGVVEEVKTALHIEKKEEDTFEATVAADEPAEESADDVTGE